MKNQEILVGPGIGESQRILLDRLKRDGESTLADLQGGLDLSRETLRGHMKALAAQDLVERAGVRRAGPGRPHVVYRLSARADDLFPRREGKLLRELATFLLENGHGKILEQFFEARSQRRREELQQRVSGLDRSQRLEAMAQILSDEGFLAEVIATDSGPRLRLNHCPLADLVAVSHLPCRAEMALVEELVGEPLQREAFMPEGGHACSYSLKGAGSLKGTGSLKDTGSLEGTLQRARPLELR